MKRVICFSFLFCVLLFSSAQTDFILSPSVVASSGDNWTLNNYNLSFTVGEIAIETFSENIILTQGFHQPNYQVTSITETPNSSSVTLFPNPTKDIVKLVFNTDFKTADLWVKDIQGKIIYQSINFSTQTPQDLQCQQWSQGVYFVEILLDSKETLIYKIQKFN